MSESAPIISRPADADPDVEAFIARMNGRYSPTKRLQADEDALNAAVDDYRRVLGKIDKLTMEAAWRLIVERHDSWCWPHVCDVIQACEDARRAAHPAGEVDSQVQEIEDLSYGYTKRFMKNSTVAARARENGYERELKEYVREASWVQAQLIVRPDAGVGYSSAVLFPDKERDRHAEEEFFEKARAQARTGHIRVHVPPAMIRRWQEEAVERGRGR